MIMEFLPMPPPKYGPVPPRLRFDPPCEELRNFLQFQVCYHDDIDSLKDMIAEVKRGDRAIDQFHNHFGAYAETTATVARIHYSLPGEEPRMALEMPLEQFERIVDIWREHCLDDAFVGVFEV